MTVSMSGTGHATSFVELRRIVAGFQGPFLWRSLIQIATSFGGFFASCAAMYLLLDLSYWLSLLLAPWLPGFWCRSSSFSMIAAINPFSAAVPRMMSAASRAVC
ncbi:hypothetical protein ACFQ4K_00975 [Tistrella bauzanensis]